MFNIDKRWANANIQRSIRFTEEIFADLNKIAAENGISFNTLVLQCCAYAMENLPKEDDSGARPE